MTEASERFIMAYRRFNRFGLQDGSRSSFQFDPSFTTMTSGQVHRIMEALVRYGSDEQCGQVKKDAV